MPVMTRTNLALLVASSVLCGVLVTQTMMQQQTDEQIMLAAQQLVYESQQASGFATGQSNTPPDGGLVPTSVPVPDFGRQELAPPLLSPVPPDLSLPPPPPPPQPPAKNFFKGKELPSGVECDENGICRHVGEVAPISRAGDSTAPPDVYVTEAASAAPPLPTPPPPTPRQSRFDLPPPPPPTPGALRGTDHPEAAQCDLKNKDGPENGVVFVNDPKARALFKDDASYNLATSEKTGAVSSLGKLLVFTAA